MYKRDVVRVTGEERARIETLVRRGRAHARSLLYARILLKADASEGGPACTDEKIAEALETSADTVATERRRFVEDGLEVALMAKKPGTNWATNSAPYGCSRAWQNGEILRRPRVGRTCASVRDYAVRVAIGSKHK